LLIVGVDVICLYVCVLVSVLVACVVDHACSRLLGVRIYCPGGCGCGYDSVLLCLINPSSGFQSNLLVLILILTLMVILTVTVAVTKQDRSLNRIPIPIPISFVLAELVSSPAALATSGPDQTQLQLLLGKRP